MAAGSVRLPELRQDIKVDTSDLTRARRVAQGFAKAMEKDLDVNTTGTEAKFDRLIKKLDQFKKKTQEIRKEMEELRDAAQDIEVTIDLDRASLERARRAIESALDDQVINVRIDIDDDSLAEAKAKLATLRDQAVQIRVELDRRALDNARALIKAAFGDETIKVKVDLDEDSLAATRALIQAAFGDETINIKVNVDTSQLTTAAAQAEALKAALNSSFNVNTQQWTRKMGEVRSTLQQLKADTDTLYKSSIALGASFKAARKAAEELKNELLALQAIAAKNIDVKVDLDEDSVAEAKMRLNSAFDDQVVNVRVDVDTSALDGARAKLAAFSRDASAAFNVDTSKWTRQMDGVRAKLNELQASSTDLKASQQALGRAFKNARTEALGLTAALTALKAIGDIKIDVKIDNDFLAKIAAARGAIKGLGDEVGTAAPKLSKFSEETERAAGSMERGEKIADTFGRRLTALVNVDTETFNNRIVNLVGHVRELSDESGNLAAAYEMLADSTGRLSADTKVAENNLKSFRGHIRTAGPEAFDLATSLDGLGDAFNHFNTNFQASANIDVTGWLNKLGQIRDGMREVADESDRVVQNQHALGDAFQQAQMPLDRHNQALNALTTELQRVNAAHLNTVKSTNQVGRSFGETGGQGVRLYQVLRNLKMAFIGLSVVGLIVPGIGALGGAVVGLAAAASDLLPGLLLLPAALTSVGVAAAGMFAIFKNNKELKQPIKELKDAFKGIQEDLQQRTTPAVKDFLKQLEGLAPVVRKQVPAFADAFNEIAKSFTQYIGSQGFLSDLDSILANSVIQFKNWGFAIRSSFESFIGLAEAGGASMNRLSASVANGAEEFRVWVAEARRTGELEHMWERMVDVLESVGRSLKNLIVGFKNLFQVADLAGFTDTVLNTLEGITADFRQFTETNQAALTAMFQNLGKQVALLRPLMADVANGIRIILTNVDLTPLIDAIHQVMVNFAEGAAEAANAIGRLVKEAAPAINSLITLVRNLIPDVERIGAAFLNNVKPAIDTIAPGIKRIGEMLANISENVMPPLLGFFRNLGDIFSGVVALLAPIFEGIGKVIGLLGNLGGAFGLLVTAILKVAIAKVIFGDLGRVITGAAEPTTKLQRAVAGVSAPVRNLAGDVKGLGTAMEGQRDKARLAGESLTTMGAASRSLMEGQSALSRSIGTVGESMDRHMAKGRELAGAYLNLNAETGRTSNLLGTLGGAFTGLAAGGMSVAKNALMGLVDAMGGPFGVAIAAVLTAIGIWQQRSQALRQEQDSLKGALEQSGGAIDTNVQKMVQANLEQTNLAAGAQALGKSQAELASAVTGTQQQFDGMITALQQYSGATETGLGPQVEFLSNLGLTQDQVGELIQAMQRNRAEFLAQQQVIRDNNATLTTHANALSTAQRATENIRDGLDKMNQAAGDSKKSIEGLTQALDGMSGRVPQLDQATRDYGEALRTAQDSAREFSGQARILNGDLDESTAAGAAMFDAMDKLRDGMLTEAQAAFQAAGGTNNMAAATAAARAKLDAHRNDLLAVARQFTNNEQEAQRYVDQLLAVPNDVLTRILADPAHAQQTYDDWKRGVPLNPPGPVPLDADHRPGDLTLDQWLHRDIPNRPPGQPPVDANIRPGELTLDQWLNGQIPHGPPAQPPVDANIRPGETTLDQWLHHDIPNPPGGAPEAPVSATTQLADQIVNALFQRITNPQGGAAQIPVKLNVDEANRQLADLTRSIVTPAGGPVRLPIGLKWDDFNAEYGAKKAEITADRSWLIPIGLKWDAFDADYAARLTQVTTDTRWKIPMAAPTWTLFDVDYQHKLDGVLADTRWKIYLHADFSIFDQEYGARLAGVLGDTGWRIPLATNFDRDFTPQFVAKMNEITNGAGWRIPMATNWDRDFTPQFLGKYNEIVNGAAWPIPMSINWDREFTPQFQAKYNEIVNGAPWPIPFSANFAEAYRQYVEFVQIVTKPLIIPVGIQFFFGGFGMGAAAGGIIANETGNIVEAHQKAADKAVKKFAKGGFSSGMSRRDHVALKASMGEISAYAPGGVEDAINQRMAQSGLTPMQANRASIVPPNSFRVIGDRAQDDEAYIPINQDSRSLAIFEETAKRMGYYVEKMAVGGFTPTSNVTNAANPSTSSSTQTVNNNSTEAPMVAGDLVITVPADTPVQDSMDEMLFQLRRIKRGGVHVRSTMRRS